MRTGRGSTRIGRSVFAVCATLFCATLWCASESLAVDSPAPSPSVYTTWRTFTTSDGIADDSIRSLHIDGGSVWVGTDYGVSRYEESTFTTWTKVDGLPDFPVSAIAVDPATQDVWLGSWGGGLVRLTGGRFDTFNQLNSGVSGDVIFDVAVVNGRIWVATDGGVSVFEPFADSWTLFDGRRSDAPQLAVTTLLHHGDSLVGNVWRTGLRRYDEGGGTWLTDAKRTGSAGFGTFEFAAVDARERLWSGSRHGVTAWHGSGAGRTTLSVAHERSLPDELRSGGFIQCAAVADDGGLWLGTDDGLLVLPDARQDVWLRYRGQDGDSATVALWRGGERTDTRVTGGSMTGASVRCIAAGRDGVWLGTAKGLVRAGNSKPYLSLPTVAPALVDRPAGPASNPKASVAPVAATRPDAMPAPRKAIAVYGPRNRTVRIPGGTPRRPAPSARADHWSIEIAIERVNALGGLSDSELLHAVTVPAGYARYGWTLPEDDIVFFQRQPLIVGIVGYMDRDHKIAEAVTYRSDVPWMNVASEDVDPVSVERSNPWVFRCFGNQPREHRTLLDYLIDTLGRRRIGALRTPGDDCARHLDWWRGHAQTRGIRLEVEVSVDGSQDSVDRAIASLQSAGVDTVLTWSDAPTSAGLLRHLRRAGSSATFVGGAALTEKAFVDAVGAEAGSVVALLGADESEKGVHYQPFAARYSERALARRRGAAPPDEAVRSYEAADHILAAMDVVGCDRIAVRDQLRVMDRSATGEEHYEKLHGPTRVDIARLERSSWVESTLEAP